MRPYHYTGDFPFFCTVVHGDSLSAIARRHGFNRWQPIWIYNTKVHRILQPDPNLIFPGTRILLPRSRAGYDRLLRNLRSLEAQVTGSADQVRYQLQGQHDAFEASRTAFDLAGDVATLLGTVAFKAAQAARAAEIAAETTGPAKVAAQYSADRHAEDLARELTGKLKDTVVNEAVGKADPGLGQAHKNLYLTQKKGIAAIRGVSLQRGKSLLDIADILLDYVSVSNVADGIIALKIGETPEKTYQDRLQAIRDSASAWRAILDEKIRKYSAERDLVYEGES